MTSIRREYEVDGRTVRISVRHVRGDEYVVQVDDRMHEATLLRAPDGRQAFRLGGRTIRFDSAPCGRREQVRVGGRTWLLQPAGARARADGAAASGAVLAPMTGTLVKLSVRPGDPVEVGQVLAVVSAMKMEHRLVAGLAGRVAEVAAEAGATVDEGALLVRIEPEPAG
jgi:biotin carboxyl carrier protein